MKLGRSFFVSVISQESAPLLGVRRLLPGHYMIWRDGDAEVRRWWNLAEKARVLRENLPADPASWYRETFDDAVKLRRISDVPVGVLLSGGLDSSSVAASLAKQAGSGVASFTVRFYEVEYDEGAACPTSGCALAISTHTSFLYPHKIYWKNCDRLHGLTTSHRSTATILIFWLFPNTLSRALLFCCLGKVQMKPWRIRPLPTPAVH